MTAIEMEVIVSETECEPTADVNVGHNHLFDVKIDTRNDITGTFALLQHQY